MKSKNDAALLQLLVIQRRIENLYALAGDEESEGLSEKDLALDNLHDAFVKVVEIFDTEDVWHELVE